MLFRSVCVPVIGQDAEVYGFGTAPFLDGFDKENDIAQPELDRAFVSFATGIAFDTDFHGVCFRLQSGMDRMGPGMDRMGPTAQLIMVAATVTSGSSRLGGGWEWLQSSLWLDLAVVF